jgi:hypothetical protein
MRDPLDVMRTHDNVVAFLTEAVTAVQLEHSPRSWTIKCEHLEMF